MEIGGLIALLWLLGTGAAAAHEIRPAIVTIDFMEQRYEIAIVVNAEALLAGIGPQHRDTDDAPGAAQYDTLRKASATALEKRFRAFMPQFLSGVELNFDGRRTSPPQIEIEVPPVGDTTRSRRTRLTLTGPIPAASKTFTWRYAQSFGSSVLKLRSTSDGDYQAEWLQPGAASEPFLLDGDGAPPSRAAIAWQYLVLGFTHIVPKGLDHMLFVLGLFLLSVRWAPLLWQVTAFTVAHSITLALSIYGVIALSPQIVEPLIALSIVYVAVENLFSQGLKPWRVAVVFAFGLLHGLGFAGVLEELGLPRSEFVTALITFNLGVEFGQLAVIAAAFVAVAWWRADAARYRRTVVIPASLLIAGIGLYWTVERAWQWVA